MVHPGDEDLQDLTLGELTTAESLRVQKHIYDCPECLKRLMAVELELVIDDAYDPPRSLKPDMTKPLFVRHDTAHGFIYSRVEKHENRWLERHSGEQLAGRSEFETMMEANEHAVAAFSQMFPEHRCTERCCLDPHT